MTDTKLCPIIKDEEGIPERCIKENCAWWHEGYLRCAILEIAINIDDIATKWSIKEQ